ncbi:MAG: hypothetical protein PF904_18645 [Kiritimatiellae bacterium]|jgi:hypothetical protein|nr:hypothetical protein [Kiritimatiellia bacterium]
MMERREFLATAATAAVGAALPAAGAKTASKKMIWGNLLHLSYNMWEDWSAPGHETRYFHPELQFDEKLWDDMLAKCVSCGVNTIVLDVGDGVKYESHPEIAVENAWSTARLHSEVQRLHKLGIECIPKLNFSTGHDAWMGKYSRMVSTDIYYGVCKDLIVETCQIFNKPRFFHLLGFLQTPWRKTKEQFRDHHMAAIEQIGAARKAFESQL